MELINITGPATTQTSGRHCILLYDCIVLSRCLVHFTLLLFALLVVHVISFSVILSLQGTILINLKQNLYLSSLGSWF